MPKFRIVWDQVEADTYRKFTAESVVSLPEGQAPILNNDQKAEPVPDDTPEYDWRLTSAPK